MNNNRLISLAAGTCPDFTPVETIHAAAEAGFGGCGIWFEASEWTDQRTRDVRAAFETTGLVPLDIEVIWIQPGDEDPDHDRQLAAGGEIGAQNVLIVSSDPDKTATKHRFERLCDKAANAGIKASLEFLPITEVKNLDDALEIVSEVGHPNGHILLDPTHLHRTGGTPADISRIPPEMLAYAQYCDGVDILPNEDIDTILADAVDGRLLPGEGEFPLNVFVASIDPSLPLSVELRSKFLRDTYSNAAERASVVLEATLNSLNS